LEKRLEITAKAACLQVKVGQLTLDDFSESQGDLVKEWSAWMGGNALVWERLRAARAAIEDYASAQKLLTVLLLKYQTRLVLLQVQRLQLVRPPSKSALKRIKTYVGKFNYRSSTQSTGKS
jgi:hypothetical protein